MGDLSEKSPGSFSSVLRSRMSKRWRIAVRVTTPLNNDSAVCRTGVRPETASQTVQTNVGLPSCAIPASSYS